VSVSLDDFKYRDTATMQVIPPGGSEPIATIVFAGPAHPKSRAQAERLHSVALRRRLVAAAHRTLNEVERENVQFLVDRMLEWEGIKRREGEEVVEVPFSEAYATEMLLNPALGWLFSQCLAFLSVDTNFLPQRSG
jgi:hypothetical protein